MKTKVPFAWRCVILCVILLAASGKIAWTLADFQLREEDERQYRASNDNIETDIIPAHRGIIMDRNREILTNNVLVAEVHADRVLLRSIDQVTYGLAYNQVIHSAEWKKTTDPQKRERLLRAKRNELLNHARRKYTADERARVHRESVHNDAAANVLLQYDPAVCEEYYAAHDKLVAELIARFAAKLPAGKDGEGPLTAAQIEDKIAQKDKVALKKEAEKRGEKSPVQITQLIYLLKELSLEDADRLRETLAASRIKGITVETCLKRSYVVPHMLTHVLGSVKKETKAGEGGIEEMYNSFLSGIPGRREYHKNARGQVIPHADDRYLEPQHGLNLQLTIDMRIQAICEAELDRGLRENNCPVGCMIVLEAISGDVIAMVNRPAFNLNTREVITPTATYEYGKYIDREKKKNNGDSNYACQAAYEPGSTFKPIAVIASLDLGKLTPRHSVNGTPFTVGGAKISDGRRSGRLSGAMSIGCALKHSCNPATVRIARTCTWKEYNSYLDKLGLLDKLPLNLPAMSKGSHKNKDRKTCSEREMASMAYGYAISVSPMHVALMYSSIANGGVRVKPRLVDSIISADGTVYDDCKPREGDTERIMKPATAKYVLQALHSVTNPDPQSEKGRGTGHTAHIPGFKIGGKTGTAEKVVNGNYIDKFHVASFAGIFPLDENINWEAEMAKPKDQRKKVYVVFTVVDGTSGGGGTAAAPIFRRVAERIIRMENIQPTDPAAYAAYLKKQEDEAKTANAH